MRMIRIWSDPPGLSFVGKGFLLSAFFVLFFSAARAQEVKTTVTLLPESNGALPKDGKIIAPALNSEPAISYPADALKERVEATVKLKMLIAEDGSVSRSEVVDDGGDNRLVRASVEGLRKARFSPGTINGTPAEMWVIAEIGFSTNRMDAMDGPGGRISTYDPSELSFSPPPSSDIAQSENEEGPGMDDFVPGVEPPQYDTDQLFSLLEYPEGTTEGTGKVIVSVRVGKKGNLLEVVVRQASDSVFIEPTLKAIRRLTFVPGTQNGRPTALWLILVANYKKSE